jgi:hypothetical protein
MSPWVWSIVHDRPVKRFEWGPAVRYGTAFGGLAIIGYFVYQIFMTRHLDRTFKFGSIAVIVVIAIVGAMAILQRDPDDEMMADGRRLYTADEVAELLNAVRANGGRFVEAAAATPANCIFCGKPDANVRGLDGTRYHRACFQRAYREREETTRRRR